MDTEKPTDSDNPAVNTRSHIYLMLYLVMVTSWRLRPCPPGVGGSWGLEQAQRRMPPVRRHGDQGTEGQHPVGSMPVVKREVKKIECHSMGLYTNTLADTFISHHLHFFHLSTFRTWHLSPLQSHNRVLAWCFVLVNWIIS